MFEKFGEYLADRREQKLKARLRFSPYSKSLRALGKSVSYVADYHNEQGLAIISQVEDEQLALQQGIADGEIVLVDFKERQVVNYLDNQSQTPAQFYDWDTLGWNDDPANEQQS